MLDSSICYALVIPFDKMYSMKPEKMGDGYE